MKNVQKLISVILVLSVFSAAVFILSNNDPSFEMHSPQQGDSFNQNEIEFQYGFDTEFDYQYKILVNGEVREELELLAGQGEERRTSVAGVPQGENVWQLQVKNLDNNDVFKSEEKTFNVTSESDIADITIWSPSGAVNTQTVHLTYEIEVYTPLTLYTRLDGEEVNARDLDSGKHYLGTELDLEEGSYSWRLEAESDERNNIETSDTSFTVEP